MSRTTPPARCLTNINPLAIGLFAILTLAMTTPPTSADWPGVRLTRVFGTGDPVPGVPDGVFTQVALQPYVANNGVLVNALYDAPGGGGQGLWFGWPGEMELVARTGQPAPNMPPGVVIGSFFSNRWCSENGFIVFKVRVTGPGITTFVNDVVVYAGFTGDIHKVIQGGDPAPEFPDGVYPSSFIVSIDSWIADDDHYLLRTFGIVEESLRLGTGSTSVPVVWTGMPAPGTEPGTVFSGISDVQLADNGRFLLLGALSGPTVDGSNNLGVWLGDSDGLELIVREGEQAPDFPEGVIITDMNPLKGFNSSDLMLFTIFVDGPGITDSDDLVTMLGTPGDLHVFLREGQEYPMIPTPFTESIGRPIINRNGISAIEVLFRDKDVDESEDWWVLAGDATEPMLVLYEGFQIPHTEEVVVLDTSQKLIIGDSGTLVVTTNVPSSFLGPDQTILLSPDLGASWRTVLRAGDILDEGRVVFDVDYWYFSGGDDGEAPALNDQHSLALTLEFTDETNDAYIAELLPSGDSDSDGDIDLTDFAKFQLCYTGSENPSIESECAAFFDFDLNGDISLVDFAEFQLAFTGPN